MVTPIRATKLIKAAMAVTKVKKSRGEKSVFFLRLPF